MLKTKSSIAIIAIKYQLDFIRLFGSAVNNTKNARDYDLLVGAKLLSLSDRNSLQEELTITLGKKVDIVQFKEDLSPLLVQEIVKHSVPLWEKPATKNKPAGSLSYFFLVERFLPIAEDELLAFSAKNKMESIKSVQKNLKKKGNSRVA